MSFLRNLILNVAGHKLTNFGNVAVSFVRGFHLMSKPPQVLCATNRFLDNKTNFLQPVSSVLVPNNGFKVKGRLKRRCKDCYFVMRQDRLYVICKTHPRHKQMAMRPREDKFWILTHATQSKVRPY